MIRWFPLYEPWSVYERRQNFQAFEARRLWHFTS